MSGEDGHMTHAEFRKLYPEIGARVQLVTLIERDGERMWQLQGNDWYRLENEPHEH